MDEYGGSRRNREGDPGAAAVRTPSSTGGSSSSDIPPPDSSVPLAPVSDSDAPTVIHLAQVSPSDSPTLIDVAPPRKNVLRKQEFVSAQPIIDEGTVLAGRYEILQTLGEGGMGAVYKAKDLALDRMVALKVIRPELARNPAIIDRFKQE